MAADPYRYFRVEARELTDDLVAGVLDLERGAVADQVVPRLLRLAHTLKGAARVVRQPAIAEGAHAVEDALEPHRATAGPVPRDGLQAVLEHLDAIGRQIAALDGPKEPAASVAEPAAAPAAAPEEVTRTVRTELADLDALLDAVGEARTHLGSLRTGIEALARARHLADRLDGSDAGPAVAARLRSTVAAAETTLTRAAEGLDRELVDVHETAEQLRLLPAHLLFNDLARAARDMARQQGRLVAVATAGGDVRLDADVLDTARPALVQAVRNAVAHGIEPAAEREAAGKPAEGRITIEVTRRGGRARLTCRDDGRGIDLEAVSAAARRQGRVGGAPAAEQVIDLLLHGGVSTSMAVTEVSGRGVGLDVVREAAERLGGEPYVETEPGRGTTVGIDVPLSFAAFTALAVEAGGRPAVVPLDGVHRVLSAVPADRARSASGEVLVLDGRAVPLVDLATVLGAPATGTGTAHLAVVVGSGDGRAAVAVDRLRGTPTVVARPLPEGAEASPVVAGVWLDPQGRPQLVLDPEGLAEAAAGARPPAVEAADPPLPVLIVDDSLTTRMLEQSILESAGYEVVLASSAEEGLDVAGRQPFGLFLVDVEMPGMDGFSFVARTRQDAELAEVPAIMVTSRDSPDDLRRGVEAGASDHIVKGEFDQERLLARIGELIRTRPREGAAP